MERDAIPSFARKQRNNSRNVTGNSRRTSRRVVERVANRLSPREKLFPSRGSRGSPKMNPVCRSANVILDASFPTRSTMLGYVVETFQRMSERARAFRTETQILNTEPVKSHFSFVDTGVTKRAQKRKKRKRTRAYKNAVTTRV